jgi:hypothetical protein
VRRAPPLLALWLMRHKVCIDPGVRALPSSAALSLRRGRLVSGAREARPTRGPHSSESRQTTRVRPRAELSSQPARDIAGAIPAQAKADVVFIDPAVKERRRIRPTAHHIPASPPLQHLDEAIIVLPGALLYLAQAVLVAWPHRSLRPVRASAVDVSGSLQRPQAYPPAHPREVLTSARTRRRAAVGRACSTNRGSTLTEPTPDCVHSHWNFVWVRSTPTTLCMYADRPRSWRAGRESRSALPSRAR